MSNCILLLSLKIGNQKGDMLPETIDLNYVFTFLIRIICVTCGVVFCNVSFYLCVAGSCCF